MCRLSTTSVMASSSEHQIGDNIECSLCSKQFTDPVEFPCIHTFCRKCVEDYAKGKLPGNKLACPFCRKYCVIPKTGISGLPVNNFISRMVRMKETSISAPACEMCVPQEANTGDKSQAKSFCVECRQNMCERCDIFHGNVASCRSHKTIKIGCQPGEFRNESLANPPNNCKIHGEKKLEKYCNDCKSLSCLNCCLDLHKLHSISDCTKVADAFCRQILDGVESLVASKKNA